MQLQTQIQEARSEFMIECARIAGVRWDECAEAYSFDAAFDEGITPAEAVIDCIGWLDS